MPDKEAETTRVTAIFEEEESYSPVSSPRSNLLPLRITCWCIALLLGAAHAWAARFSMNPDGISYLDIGDAYWRGDWHNAINACWSPLYSWTLGFFLKVLKPSMYWEYPLVHLVNFLIYVAALAGFEFFLRTFIEDRKRREQELAKDGQTGLSEFSWWLLGYGLFVATSLLLIGLETVTPDMLVAGFVYVASALTLRIRIGGGTREFVLLGLVLGLAYLNKTVMFPLAPVFLAIAFMAGGISRRSLRNLAIATLLFLGTSGPFVTAISWQRKHFTFGEAGAWVYALYVNHIDYLSPDRPDLKHPPKRLSVSPPILEFGAPLAGTFPLMYDPTYWHEGIKPRFTLISELDPIAKAAQEYWHEFFVLFLNVTVGFGILLFTGDSLRNSLARASRSWPITVPAIATLGLYSLVHVEGRFIAAPVTLLFLGAFSGVAVPLHDSRRRVAAYTVALVALSLLTLTAFSALVERRKELGPVYATAASALQQDGVNSGARIGLVWDEIWNRGAARGAFVPRLLKAKIVVEETNANDFWKLDDGTRTSILAKMQAAGAQAILAYRIPPQVQGGWEDLGGTGYFTYIFPTSGASPPR